MKAVNFRKYDILCPCINGSKITALCDIGNRIHWVELKNKNISGLNQQGFLNFGFFFTWQLVYPPLYMVWIPPKNSAHNKSMQWDSPKHDKAYRKKPNNPHCFKGVVSFFTSFTFLITLIAFEQSSFQGCYVQPTWHHKKSGSIVRNMTKLKQYLREQKEIEEAGDKGVQWTHCSLILYQRAIILQTGVAQFLTVIIIFRDTANLYLLYWKYLWMEFWSATPMTVLNFRLQYTSSHSCSLAYARSNAYVAVGKMDEFAEISNYHLQKLFSTRSVKCFLLAHS